MRRSLLLQLAGAAPRGQFVQTMSLPNTGLGSVPSELQDAVLLKSEPMPADSIQVKGHDYSEARWT